MESEVEVFVVKVWVGKKAKKQHPTLSPSPFSPPIPPSSMLVGFFFVEALLV